MLKKMMETIVRERGNIRDHEKLDAYPIAVEFEMISDAIVENLPRGRGSVTALRAFNIPKRS